MSSVERQAEEVLEQAILREIGRAKAELAVLQPRVADLERRIDDLSRFVDGPPEEASDSDS